MNLSNLTIACVTYGRPKYVGRLIEYWQSNFDDAQIYILDGSKKKLDEKYLNKISLKNINYIHMQEASIFKRYLYIKEILKTKYFHLVADDEIFVRSGVQNSIDFLEQNLNYSSCCGQMILFTPLLKKEVFALSPYELYSNESLLSSERVRTWLVHSQPNSIYSIIRSEFLIKILNECSKFDEKKFSKPDLFMEDLIEIGIAFQGKTKIIDKLMWMRSVENTRTQIGNDRLKPEVTLFDNKEKNKKIFFDNFIQNYFKNLDVNFNNSDSIDLKKLYYERLETIRKNKVSKLYANIFKFEALKKAIFKIIPKNLKKRIRYYFKLNGPEIIEFLEKNNKDINFDKKEILDIKKFILNFYNNKFYN